MHRSVLQLDTKLSDAILHDYSAVREAAGGSITSHEDITLGTLGSIRGYYYARRCVALEVILEMCRVARDHAHPSSTAATDTLTDMFTTVEATEGNGCVSYFTYIIFIILILLDE